MSRYLSQWFSKHKEARVEGVSLKSAATEERDARSLVKGCLEIINEPGFANDKHLASQLHVVGCLRFLTPHWPAPCQTLYGPFMKKTGMLEPRFRNLLTMPWNPEIERQIRSGLKAARVESRDPLPGEAIFPRTNWLGQYLNYSEGSESPLAYHFWCGMALLGAACRRNVYFTWGYHLFPNLYLFIVGPSALGKGMAIDRTTPLLGQANDIWRENMAEHIGEDGPCENNWWPNKQVVILPSTATPQDIIKHMVPKAQDTDAPGSPVPLKGVDSVSWLANGEASSFLVKRDNLASLAIKIYTEVYNCEERGFSQGTIARGHEELKFQCFNLLLGSTLEWINTSVSTDMLEAGFVRRCMFVYRDRDVEMPSYNYTPPPDKDPLQATILSSQLAFWMGMETSREIEPDEKALRLIGVFRKKNREEMLNPNNYRMLPYYIGKFNLVMKAASALTVNQYTSPDITHKDLLRTPKLKLRGEEMEQAIQLVEFEEEYMGECFSRMGEHKQATEERKIIETCRAWNRETKKPMLRSELRRQCGSVSNFGSRVSAILENGTLHEEKLVGRVKAGRKPTRYWCPATLPDWGRDDDDT